MFDNKFKRNEALLEASDSALIIVDMQERFAPAIPNFNDVSLNVQRLIKACGLMDIPVIHSQQYSKGLGNTVPEISNLLADSKHLEKMEFSAVANGDVYSRLKELKKRQILIVGIEAHVCVLQTALDLSANFDGWVYCAADAVSSRKQSSLELALRRMENNNVNIVNTEMALFEWMESAGHKNFKDIQKLVL